MATKWKESKAFEDLENNGDIFGDELDYSIDDEISSISWRFKKFLKWRVQGNIRFLPRRKESLYKHKEKEALQDISCFGCNKLWHIRNECPKMRRKHGSTKKSLMTTWEEKNLGSYSNTDEHVNFYLMEDVKSYYLTLTHALILHQPHHAHYIMKMRKIIYLMKISSPIITPSLKNILR